MLYLYAIYDNNDDMHARYMYGCTINISVIRSTDR